MNSGKHAGWTSPLHGVYHYPSSPEASVWATVTVHDRFATCALYRAGRGAIEVRQVFPTAEEARAHGEARVALHVGTQAVRA